MDTTKVRTICDEVANSFSFQGFLGDATPDPDLGRTNALEMDAHTFAAKHVLTSSAPPSLSISSNHDNNFAQGQVGTYTVVVSNEAGWGSTSKIVTVTESVPNGLNLVSMAGAGWVCPQGGTVCTRNDALVSGGSYPPITVMVNVLGNPGSPVGNKVTVTGGGNVSAPASTTATTLQ